MSTIRPHRYQADMTLAGREWHGARRCARCQLPKSNQVHDVGDDFLEETAELSARILGEANDQGDM